MNVSPTTHKKERRKKNWENWWNRRKFQKMSRQKILHLEQQQPRPDLSERKKGWRFRAGRGGEEEMEEWRKSIDRRFSGKWKKINFCFFHCLASERREAINNNKSHEQEWKIAAWMVKNCVFSFDIDTQHRSTSFLRFASLSPDTLPRHICPPQQQINLD